MMTSMTSTMLVGLLAMAGATQADASGGSGSLQLRFNFEATVQADGSVADVQPDPALPASIQARVKQAAATWRYAPIRWQGQAIQVRIVQQVKVEATPRPEGGTALRIVEVVKPARIAQTEDHPAVSRMPPPRFPSDLMQAGITATLVYAVLFGENGVPQAIELIYPTTQDSAIVRLDQASRKALHQWVVQHTFRGAPIACRAKVPVTFVTTRSPETLRPPPEVDALFESYADRCPEVKLETPVVGTSL